jgi:Trypsin
MRRRRTIALVSGLFVALALGLPSGVASANSGDPTGEDTFTNVGALITTMELDGIEVQRFQGTGSLISPDRFLASQHQADRITWLKAQPNVEDLRVWVTFTADLDGALPTVPGYGFPVDVPASALVPVDETATERMPGYRPTANPAFNDLAIFTLDDPVTGIDPVTLPSAALDPADLQASPVLTAAGYGLWFLWDTGPSRTTRGNPKGWVWDGGLRRAAEVAYQALTPDFLVFSTNEESRLGGGVCGGDSGAPVFFQDVQVAVSIWGDMTCRSINFNQRLDTTEVRDWIEGILG